MGTYSVKLVPLGKVFETNEGTPLIDILHEYGVEFPCGGKGTCGRCRVKVLEGKIETDASHRNKLQHLGLAEEWRLACLSSCTENLVLEVGQYEVIIQADETPFDFTPLSGLGIAFDLGTTTLVGQLLDLSNGRILAVETDMNPQKVYGSDLVSRLEAALKGKGEEMTQIIREKIGAMTWKMMKGRDLPLERMVIVGNSVMQHFFCGHDIRPLSFFPFESPHLKRMTLSPEELGWDLKIKQQVDFYPSIGSFVGSDILAGILATGMHRKDSFTALIDLGTNGEIVIGNKDRLLCASTAAGPAFEGAKISQGMQATTGAISSIEAGGEGWNCSVIGNVPSRGICGSGLFDAIALFLDKGLIGEFGEIVSGEQEIALDSTVSLSQKDIQEFQLGKAAISAGFEILLRKLGIGTEAISDVYIAGGFGNYLNLKNVIRVGMHHFPEEVLHKLGNSALIGAKMFLFEGPDFPQGILDLCEHVSLEAEPGFQDIFIENLGFGS